nr:MAG TPA: hypothetical protein [Caudoviricetes sp.]
MQQAVCQNINQILLYILPIPQQSNLRRYLFLYQLVYRIHLRFQSEHLRFHLET